ncbi:hypothetical protein EGW08_010034 [Elysia chlorotica]|uniref:Fibrinogen C-terminal domain-containing protein n=1 Tax=Elysia chlorotica TaxID=188477 RepID=A0A433TKV1_ELYCH|nr:hypothetical protein EGW08_010034 [Elysia chlorotica]
MATTLSASLLCLLMIMLSQQQTIHDQPRNPNLRCRRYMLNGRKQPYQVTYEPLIQRYVLCDAKTDYGGWIIFQRRMNGLEDFYKPFDDYHSGFGVLGGDHWLGLEHMHKLTFNGNFEMRVDVFYEGSWHHATFDRVWIGKTENNYILTLVGNYRGDLPNDVYYGIQYSNGMPFTTLDRDNDWAFRENCAESHVGAWWYKWCTRANLNGRWRQSNATGMFWRIPGEIKYVEFSEMKIRRRGP